MNEKMICWVDIDDTLNNLKTNWLALYNELSGDDLQESAVVDWDMSKFVKKGWEKKIYTLLETPGLFRNCKPLQDSQSVIHGLSEIYDIHIITSCNYPRNYIEKVDFIKEFYPTINPRQIIACGSPKGKLIKGHVLIDDYHENLHGFDGLNILFNQPHNSLITRDELPPLTIRVNNWLEIHYMLWDYYFLDY